MCCSLLIRRPPGKAFEIHDLTAEVVVDRVQLCTILMVPPVAVAADPLGGRGLAGIGHASWQHGIVLLADGTDPRLDASHIMVTGRSAAARASGRGAAVVS